MERVSQTSHPSHFDAAAALAQAIREEARWIEWNAATETADADPELVALLVRHRDLSARTRAGRVDKDEMMKVVGQIRRHPAYRRQEDAVEAMVGLLREVNVTLSEQLGVDFASTAAPQKSGGCCG